MVFSMFYAITSRFFIEFQKLKKENLQKNLLFHLLVDQKVLAPLIQQPELFKDADVCFLCMFLTGYSFLSYIWS